jgi:hypothetical protein
MNMLLHNLKVALRNILKYKVQTLGNILSLAIGMVTLATVHSFLLNFRMASINHEPYYDRVYNLRFDSIQKRQSDNSIHINGDIVRAVKANGGPRCIEQGPYASNGMLTGGWAEFTLSGKTRRKMQLDAVPLDRNYPNFVGIRSAITGEKIKVLGPHDAIINEKQAKQIFGDKNPVGASIRLSKSYGNYQLRLVDVYQDLSLTELDMSSSALFYSPCELEDMDSDQFNAGNLYVKLQHQFFYVLVEIPHALLHLRLSKRQLRFGFSYPTLSPSPIQYRKGDGDSCRLLTHRTAIGGTDVGSRLRESKLHIEFRLQSCIGTSLRQPAFALLLDTTVIIGIRTIQQSPIYRSLQRNLKGRHLIRHHQTDVLRLFQPQKRADGLHLLSQCHLSIHHIGLLVQTVDFQL